MKKTPKSNRDLPLAAYLRVSTHGQADSGVGMDAQRQAIEQAAAAQGLTIGSWHEDAGRSGARMDTRPGLREALAEVEAGRAGGIVCAKVDRLGRSSRDVMGLVERAHDEGWRLIALDAGLDTTTAAGEMVAAALAMAARFEYRRISERQLDKHDVLRRQERPRGRPATAREIADRIIAEREAGRTWQAIADALNAEGVPTTRGAAEWQRSSVRSSAEAREKERDAQATA